MKIQIAPASGDFLSMWIHIPKAQAVEFNDGVSSSINEEEGAEKGVLSYNDIYNTRPICDDRLFLDSQ
jgi:hypothetical protein